MLVFELHSKNTLQLSSSLDVVVENDLEGLVYRGYKMTYIHSV